jgi:hypothetical protein
LPISERFEDKFVKNKSTGCWNWTASSDEFGYGRFRVGEKLVGAHRFSWVSNFGEIPDGLLVCHKCDTPSCVNPDHLFLGTDADNSRDKMEKGRLGNRKGSANGHATLNSEKVAIIRGMSSGSATYTEIANLFGVTKGAISKVVTRRTWGELP